MSGIMNNYFYGKAGQADYTVDQMPTTRKQLFFTTLKVRFSSMIGLNLLYFLFMIPLLILLVVGTESLGYYAELTPDSTQEDIARLESVAPEAGQAYRSYAALNLEYEYLIGKYGDQAGVYKAFENEGTLYYEWEETVKGEGEDAEPVIKTNTKPINKEYWDTKLKDREEGETEYSERVQNQQKYALSRIQAKNGHLVLSLMIAIPLFAIASVGRPGMMYVLRNWARDDHSFMWQDFREAIKDNWKQSLPLGIMNGLSFLLFFVAWTTYADFAARSSWLFGIAQGLMLVLLIIWWMMNEVIYVMMVTYQMKLFTLIRNSVLMVVARLPIAFLILLGSVGFPFLIMMIPFAPYNILVIVIIYLLIGFAFTGFVQASFANSCFDRYLNPRIEGAEVNKGLYVPDEEEKTAEEQDEPEVPVKEDRYWEHKTK